MWKSVREDGTFEEKSASQKATTAAMNPSEKKSDLKGASWATTRFCVWEVGRSAKVRNFALGTKPFPTRVDERAHGEHIIARYLKFPD